MFYYLHNFPPTLVSCSNFYEGVYSTATDLVLVSVAYSRVAEVQGSGTSSRSDVLSCRYMDHEHCRAITNGQDSFEHVYFQSGIGTRRASYLKSREI